MADVRINGRRAPALQAVDTVGGLVQRLDTLGLKNNTALTSLAVNGRVLDLDNPDILRLKLDREDTIEAKMETTEQLAFESLQVALEMAELLVFDIKVATLNLWEDSKYQEKSLETLLSDCSLFLTLGSQPVSLLGRDVRNLPKPAEDCLRQLDVVANNLEDATLLAVNSSQKDACHVLVGRVMPAIEKWIGLSASFAEQLQIDRIELPPTPPEALQLVRS